MWLRARAFLRGVKALPAVRFFDRASVMCGWNARASGTKPHFRRAAVTVLLESQQLRCDRDAGREDAGALEEIQSRNLNGNGDGTHRRQAGVHARGLVAGGVAEELEGYMPAFRRGPAQIVARGRQESLHAGQRSRGLVSERDSDEQTHRRQTTAAVALLPKVLPSRCAWAPNYDACRGLLPDHSAGAGDWLCAGVSGSVLRAFVLCGAFRFVHTRCRSSI